MAKGRSAVPNVVQSNWNHGTPKKGIVYTATHSTEVLITHENLFQSLKEEGSSCGLTSLLDSMADCYNTDYGNYAFGHSVEHINPQTKRWILDLAEFIKEQ